jgi:hypothetical protein
MEIHNSENKLGKFRAAYPASLGKVVVNLILVPIWFFLGYFLVHLLWTFYEQRLVAGIISFFFVATGLAYVLVPFYRRVGRKAQLYEEGILINIRGREQSWRFDKIDDVRMHSRQGVTLSELLSETVGGALGQGFGALVGAVAKPLIGGVVEAVALEDKRLAAGITRYQFFAGGVRAFEVGPEYKQWRELGEAVVKGVMDQLVPRLLDRLTQGEPLVFDKLLTEGFSKTSLVLTREGLQEKDKQVLWTEVRNVWRGEIGGFATIETSSRWRNIVFGLDGSLNAQTAFQLIKLMAERARTEKK